MVTLGRGTPSSFSERDQGSKVRTAVQQIHALGHEEHWTLLAHAAVTTSETLFVLFSHSHLYTPSPHARRFSHRFALCLMRQRCCVRWCWQHSRGPSRAEIAQQEEDLRRSRNHTIASQGRGPEAHRDAEAHEALNSSMLCCPRRAHRRGNAHGIIADVAHINKS